MAVNAGMLIAVTVFWAFQNEILIKPQYNAQQDGRLLADFSGFLAYHLDNCIPFSL